MTRSKWVTLCGIAIAVGAVFIDPTTTPALVALLGPAAAAKVAAVGALIAGLGRALLHTEPAPPAPPAP